MKILFDGQAFVMQATGGISRYFTKLATGLNSEPDIAARVVAPLHCNDHLSDEPSAPVLGLRMPKSWKAKRACQLALRAASPAISHLMRPDIAHETYFSEKPYLTSARRRVATMFDMIHEIHFPGSQTSQRKRDALDRCDHVICISNNTKKDLCELFNFPPERASVTHLAYQDFSNTAHGETPADLTETPYFLYVGHRSGYKNFDALVRAYASDPRLVRDFRVVSFGSDPFTGDELEQIAKLGLSTHQVVHLAGNDDLLGTAYSNATAFVYPSLYEGFGIPPLEAMSAGCPVISSNSSSLPEVVGDAALLVDPNDVDALADTMNAVAQSQDLRQKLVDRGHQQRQLFSWERCVTETRNIYQSIL